MTATQATDPRAARKYQVFISSTFQDLKEARAEAIIGVSMCRHIPVALDDFPPAHNDAIDVIRREIEASQVYVLILGARYGSVEAGKDIGYVEREYDLALERAKHGEMRFLVFVLNSDEVATERRNLDATIEADRIEIGHHDKLKAFHAKVTANRFCKPWTRNNLRAIREGVILALSSLPFEPDAPGGFVRETPQASSETLLRIASSSAIITEVMKAFDELEEKLAIAPQSKASIASAFCALKSAELREYKQLFLESGSTIAMIARDLADGGHLRGGAAALPHVRTNNAFAYLYLWLCKKIFCEPVPPGPADGRFGGMYGDLTGRDRATDYEGRALPAADRKLVDHVKGQVFMDGANPGDCLILAASSGLQLNDDIEAGRMEEKGWVPCGDKDQRTIEQLRKNGRGFHVGSYYNKLFKRSLYGTGQPTIVFIHDDKINCRIDVRRCQFVCDTPDEWRAMMETYPLSIWIACTGDNYQTVITNLEQNLDVGEWHFATYALNDEHPVVITHNAAFRAKAPSMYVEST